MASQIRYGKLGPRTTKDFFASSFLIRFSIDAE